MLGHAPTYAWYSAEYGSGRLGQDEYEAVPLRRRGASTRGSRTATCRRCRTARSTRTSAPCAPACEALADLAASSYTAGGVSERLVDAESMSVDRAIDRMLAQAPGRILYGPGCEPRVPHTVTVWRRDGEDGDRRAVGQARPARGQVDRGQGQELRHRGLGEGRGAPARPSRHGRMRHVVGAAQGRPGHARRVVVPGPEPQALAVESVEPVRRGRAVDHYEATAR